MRRVIRELPRALGATIALLALLVGLPAALTVFVGWPLPTAVPSLVQVRDALGGSTISDAVLIKGIALLCWALWGQLALCAVAEMRAWAAGRAAASIPTARLLQPFVRQLVVSALVVIGSARVPVPAGLIPGPASIELTLTPPMNLPLVALAATPGVTPVASPGVTTPPLTYTVQPMDDLWRLAEEHLGDGMRWHDLYDLNRGLPQPDGRSLQNPDLIYPGWVLRLPPDAVGLAAPAPNPAPTPAAALPPAAPQSPVVQGPSATPLPTVASPEPSPAHTAHAPAPVAPIVPTAPRPAAPPNGTDRQPPGPAPAHPAPKHPSEHRHPDRTVAPIGEVLIGSGLVATGAVLTLDRLRRAQQRRRQPGRMIPVPTDRAADAELALRRQANRAPTDRLDAALRAMASYLAEASPMPEIDAVTVSPDTIEILLSAPVNARAGPFEVTAGGRAWTLAGADVPAEIAEAAATRAAPTPSLVVVGTVDDRQVLVDLEHPPRTVIGGDAATGEELWSALALNLATSAWADDLRLVVIGPPPPGVAGLERVTVASHVDDVIDELEAEAHAFTSALAGLECPSAIEARVRDLGDGWTPTVVLIRRDEEPHAVARLNELARTHHGIAVVTFGEPPGDGSRVLRLDGERMSVEPPRLDVLPIRLRSDDGVGELIELAASDREGDQLLEIGDAEVDAETDRVDAAGRPDADGPWVTVRVHGSVGIEGGKSAVDRRRCRELVVYLALHPEGVDEGRIKAALWPKSVPTDAAFNQTVSFARTALGLGPDGQPHLLHVSDRLYRMGRYVRTDHAVLKAALRLAKAKPSADSMARLADALADVRGLPFEGERGGFEWAYSEGHVAAITAVISEGAHLFAGWSLDHEDPSAALSAANEGLRSVPADEVLYRDRMLAHDQAGDPAGVDADMDELCRVIETVEPYDSVHPETLALYEELSRHRRGRIHQPDSRAIG